MTREDLDLCLYALAMARVQAKTLANYCVSFEATKEAERFNNLEREFSALFERISAGDYDPVELKPFNDQGFVR